MAATNPSSLSEPRLADRLSAARRGRFVGRLNELELFRSRLLSGESSFAVLYVHGPGGVGKTTLLREFARVAAECGRPVVQLDGRNIETSPLGFRLALRQSLGLSDVDVSDVAAKFPSDGVLLLDTYEVLAPLDDWLRETFLPELPSNSLLVITGRNPPEPAWRTDSGWANLTHIAPLGNLSPEESQTYLAARGIPNKQHRNVLAFTYGHPLALALVADLLGQGGREITFQAERQPDILRILLERLVQEIPNAAHRLALEVSVRVWSTTEALLASVLDAETENVLDLFEWLRALSFIEEGPYGLFPHDLVREALDAEMRWRDPEGFRQLNKRLSAWLRLQLEQARGVKLWRAWFDMLYLERHNPFLRPYFEWSAMGSAYMQPAAPPDHESILSMVRRYEGETSGQIAHYWLQRQPQAFHVIRNVVGDLLGFGAQLEIQQATPKDAAADPAVAAALRFVQDHGPLRQGEEIVYERFLIDREAYQRTSSTYNLLAVSSIITWTTRPRLAWNFIAIADPAYYEPHFTSIHLWHSPEADFEVDGHAYSVFAHDWRVESASVWLDVKAELALVTEPTLELPSFSTPSTALVLTEIEFADAVRQALRDYTNLDRLVTNPLMNSHSIPARSPEALQALLQEAATVLQAHPKDMKLYRAICQTYLEPAETQERAAELLQLPFNTYRYQLARGIKRIADWLWQRELSGAGR